MSRANPRFVALIVQIVLAVVLFMPETRGERFGWSAAGRLRGGQRRQPHDHRRQRQHDHAAQSGR